MPRSTTRREKALAHAIGASMFLCAFTSSGVADAEGSCDDPRISIRGALDERWLDAVLRVCEELRTNGDADPSAKVRIRPAGKDLVVDVVLGDGRAALRRIHEPSDLARTLAALLTLPRVAPPPTEPNELPPSEPSAPSPPPPLPPASWGVELGIAASGRIADNGYRSFAPDAFAALRARAWVFGMNARWDVVQTRDNSTPGLETETVSAALFLARRLDVGIGTTDVGLALRLLSETQSVESNAGETSDTRTDVRAGTFARIAFGTTPWRGFVAIDADLSPSRIRRELRIDPQWPALPAWSAGLALGVSWSER